MRRSGSLARIIAPTTFVSVLSMIPPSTIVADEVSWSNPMPTGAEVLALAVDHATGRIHAVGALGALVTSDADGLTWTDRSHPAVNAVTMRAIRVAGPDHLVAVGDAPGVLQSVDGGESWELDEVAGVASLADVEISPSGAITAVGADGAFVRSTDGGMTWSRSTISTIDLLGHGWRTATSGYAVGWGEVLETDDGGDTWSPRDDIPSFAITTDVEWHDPDHGFILEVGGYLESIDGGATWTPDGSVSGEPTYVETLVPLDADTWVAPQNADGAFLYRTDDAGASWEVVDVRPWAAGFTAAVRTPGGAVVVASFIGDLLRSTDGGVTWTNTVATPADSVRVTLGAIAARPDGALFASGRTEISEVQTLRSSDGGESWSIVDGPGPWVRALAFGSNDVGYAGGDPDVIHRTDDGGLTWTTTALDHPLGGDYRVSSIAALDDLVAYAGGFGSGEGGVYRTLDGGETWTLQTTGIPIGAGVSMITFVDGRGYASVYQGGPRLYATTHGSDVWELLPATGLPGVIEDVEWRSSSVAIAGCVLGASGGIARTTDGGLTWDVVHPRPCHGIVARADGTLLALPRSGDGLLRSEDDGLTWTDLALPVPGPMSCAVASGDDVLVGGEASRILRIAPSGTVGVVAETVAPGVGALRAAIPVGPRPTLVVDGVQGRVDVDLFDVTGRRVARIGADAGARGSTTLAWTGADDRGRPVAPGVYLARLRGTRGAGVRLILNR